MNPLELFLFLTFLHFAFFYRLPLFIIYVLLLILYIVFSQVVMKPNRSINNLDQKRSIAAYKGPSEGMIMVSQEIDVTNALPYIQELREKIGHKITITHLAIRAVGQAVEVFPEIHGHLKFGNFDHEPVYGLSVIANVDEGSDAIPYTFNNPSRYDVPGIAQFLNEKVKIARTVKDQAHIKRVSTIKSIPPFINQFLSYFITYMANNIGWNLPGIIPKRPYGQSVLTNVGVFGMKKGFSCLSPISGFNLFTAMGALHKKVKVIDGKLQIRSVITFNYSVDHRFGDGAKAVKFCRVIDEYFKDPKAYDEKLKN